MNKRLELREKNLKQQPEAEKGQMGCLCIFFLEGSAGRVRKERDGYIEFYWTNFRLCIQYMMIRIILMVMIISSFF